MGRLRESVLNQNQREVREVSAKYLNASTLTYQDVDGDNVIVRLLKPLLTTANAPTIFPFSNAFATVGPQQLRSINLTSLGAATMVTSIAFSAFRSPFKDGDGLLDRRWGEHVACVDGLLADRVETGGRIGHGRVRLLTFAEGVVSWET